MPARKEALGSFRGVPFYTVTHDSAGGRRAPTYQIPFSEKGVRFADVGRAAKEISINALVVGQDYRNQRDALVAALEQSGEGLLIHPDYGRLTVVVTDRYRVSESTEELGMARISFSVIETDGEQELRQRDPAANLDTVVEQGKKIAAKVFDDGLPTPTLSDLVAASRLAIVDSFIADLVTLNNAISRVLQIPSQYAGQIRSLANNVHTLMSTPSFIASSLMSVMDALAYASARVQGDGGEDYERNVEAALSFITSDYQRELAIESFAALGSSTQEVPDLDTPERNAERSERTAMLTSMQAAGLLSIAGHVDDYRYDSAQQAARTRDQLVKALLNLSDRDEIDPTLSDALRDAASSVVTFFRDAIIPSTTSYTPATTLPIEVIAYDLYEDAERSDEIVARNHIRDPGLVPGGVSLEVLTS